VKISLLTENILLIEKKQPKIGTIELKRKQKSIETNQP